ncbi:MULTISPECIES: DMT family transporter [unclassified Iodidimonas]|jgi:O-acetylserine/cysteine efflux transporter|uniref:DMT family transporter n=1 Tax=unclassified Iodidimonas TaxID=2626145 RepID=UPI0024822374|nr:MULTISPECIES: DMT family transporter [unclassified Iodidimonas]
MSLGHILFVLLITLLWGVNFAAIAVAVDHFPPLLANAIRFAMVLTVLFPFLKPVRGQMKILLSLACILGIFHFGSVFLAMAVSVDLAPVAIIAQTNVPFAVILAVIFLNERIGIWRISGIALSFAGVVVLGFEPGGTTTLTSIGLVLFSAFSYAVVAILMRRIKGAHPMTVQAWTALAAIPGSLFLSSLFEFGQAEALGTAPWQAYAAIAYSALGASILGHGGMNYLYQKYPVTLVSPFLLMAPVFAVLTAVLFLDEHLSISDLLGGAMTLLGVLIISLRARKKATNRP